MIECHDVSREFGTGRRRLVALASCTVRARPGEVIGVVGPNGAGKTTLLRLLAGDLPPSAGRVRVAGHPAASRQGRAVVGYAADPPVAPVELTGREWLAYVAAHRSRTVAERSSLLDRVVALAELASFSERPIRQYSRGMRQRLALATAAVAGRSVMLLDEVLGGIDPLVARRLRSRILDLAAEGRVIVVASHNLSTIERLASRVLVLWRGRLIANVRMGALLTKRVAEISLPGAGLETGIAKLAAQFPDATRTGSGLIVPLDRLVTPDLIATTCRKEGITVTGIRCRYRALEDLLVAAEAGPTP